MVFIIEKDASNPFKIKDEIFIKYFGKTKIMAQYVFNLYATESYRILEQKRQN